MKAEFCNICGSKLDDIDSLQNFRIHRVCGYGSKYDMEEIDLVLCCGCFDKIVDSCAIPPLVSDQKGA